MIELDNNSAAFVAHYRHLPIPERMLLALEKQISLFGPDGTRVAAILENAGTRNGAAIQHYYGNKDTLLKTAYLYRAKAFNDWSAQYRAQFNRELSLNQAMLGIFGAWAYIIQQTLPFSYCAGFVHKLDSFNPGVSTEAEPFPWSGPMKALFDRIVALLEEMLGTEQAGQRLSLGSLHITSTWSAKERELRQQLSDKTMNTDALTADIHRYAIELSESISANLLRERYTPAAEDPSPLLIAVDRACGRPDWFIANR